MNGYGGQIWANFSSSNRSVARIERKNLKMSGEEVEVEEEVRSESESCPKWGEVRRSVGSRGEVRKKKSKEVRSESPMKEVESCSLLQRVQWSSPPRLWKSPCAPITRYLQRVEGDRWLVSYTVREVVSDVGLNVCQLTRISPIQQQ